MLGGPCVGYNTIEATLLQTVARARDSCEICLPRLSEVEKEHGGALDFFHDIREERIHMSHCRVPDNGEVRILCPAALSIEAKGRKVRLDRMTQETQEKSTNEYVEVNIGPFVGKCLKHIVR